MSDTTNGHRPLLIEMIDHLESTLRFLHVAHEYDRNDLKKPTLEHIQWLCPLIDEECKAEGIEYPQFAPLFGRRQ